MSRSQTRFLPDNFGNPEPVSELCPMRDHTVDSDTLRTQPLHWARRGNAVAYVVVVLCSVIVAFGYGLRTNGVFACSAGGYASGRYLAYCQANRYGDYDHGAFWFELEPQAPRSAALADVLFLGNSRMQFAFSAAATQAWFATVASSYYLLGFSHDQNLTFAGPLLAKLSPRARVVVINVDDFFNDTTTWLGQAVFQDSQSRSRYERKQSWQSLHRRVCRAFAFMCGNAVTFYRLPETGSWQLHGAADFKALPVADATDPGTVDLQHQVALAQGFVAHLPARRDCIVLTIAPWAQTRRAEAAAIAHALGLDLVAPQLEGLATYDGSHLDRKSAERWSAAFFDAAGPAIRRCLDQRGTAR
jgi:hypothetical protein